MPRAFVMINVKVGTDTEVVKELKRLKHVTGVWEVYSLYDIVAEVQTNTLEEIWQVINSEIRLLANILSTHTMIVAK